MRFREIADARNAVFFNRTGGFEPGKSSSAERPPLIIHHSSYTPHHTRLIIHHSSYTTHHNPTLVTVDCFVNRQVCSCPVASARRCGLLILLCHRHNPVRCCELLILQEAQTLHRWRCVDQKSGARAFDWGTRVFERTDSYRSICSYRKLPPPACPGTACNPIPFFWHLARSQPCSQNHFCQHILSEKLFCLR